MGAALSGSQTLVGAGAYDAEIRIGLAKDVFDKNVGWRLAVHEATAATLADDSHGFVRIALIGHSGAGKTWLLRQLAAVGGEDESECNRFDAVSEDDARAPSLGMKLLRLPHPCAVLDSIGLNSPVTAARLRKACADTGGMPNGATRKYFDAAVQEELQTQDSVTTSAALGFASIVMFVVGDILDRAERELPRLTALLKETKTWDWGKELIIVHNLKNRSVDDLRGGGGRSRSYIDEIREKFGVEGLEAKPIRRDSPTSPIALKGRLMTGRDAQVHHVFLTDHTTDAGQVWNGEVLEFLRDQMGMRATTTGDVIDEVCRSMSEALGTSLHPYKNLGLILADAAVDVVDDGEHHTSAEPPADDAPPSPVEGHAPEEGGAGDEAAAAAPRDPVAGHVDATRRQWMAAIADKMKEDGAIYEAVIKPRKFQDVYDAGMGWEIDTHDDLQALRSEKCTIRVAPIGHFNVGKTFIVNKLSGRALPTGEQHHTEGLSVAVSPFSSGQIAWLDTAGLDSPVVHNECLLNATQGVEMAADDLAHIDRAAAKAHQARMMSALRGELREVKGLEDFHRLVAFEFADVFLFVVGQMTHQDQVDIMALVKRIEEQRHQARSKRVFVVHNLKDWTMEHLEKKRRDGLNYIERVQALFFMQHLTVKAEGVLDANDELVVEGRPSEQPHEPLRCAIPKLYGTFGQSADDAVQMHHVFVLNDKLEKKYNAAVFAHLRAAVALVLGDRQSVKAALEGVATRVQTQFADVSASNAPPLRMVKAAGDGKWRMHSVTAARPTEPATANVAAQLQELPSYLTLGSDDLQFDIVSFVGRIPPLREGGKSVDKVIAGVQIVVPGMTPADVERVRERVRFSGTDPALRIEAVEGVRTLTVDLHAVERAMPQGFLQTMWEVSQSEEQLDLPSEPVFVRAPGDLTVVDPGTRPTFGVDNSRSMRVQLRTGLESVSTLKRPVVTYNDGVLCIWVTTNMKPPPQKQ